MLEISFLHLNKHKFHLYLFVNDILSIVLVMRNYPPLLVAAGHEFVPGAHSYRLTIIDIICPFIKKHLFDWKSRKEPFRSFSLKISEQIEGVLISSHEVSRTVHMNETNSPSKMHCHHMQDLLVPRWSQYLVNFYWLVVKKKSYKLKRKSLNHLRSWNGWYLRI